MSDLFAKYVAAAEAATETNLTTVDGKLSCNQDGMREAWVAGLPEWADEEKVTELVNYDKGFNKGFSLKGVEIMGGYLKENEQVDSLSIGFESPMGGQYIDFARPQGDEVTKEDKVNSFGLRRSLDGGEELIADVRVRLGNLYE